MNDWLTVLSITWAMLLAGILILIRNKTEYRQGLDYDVRMDYAFLSLWGVLGLAGNFIIMFISGG